MFVLLCHLSKEFYHPPDGLKASEVRESMRFGSSDEDDDDETKVFDGQVCIVHSKNSALQIDIVHQKYGCRWSCNLVNLFEHQLTELLIIQTPNWLLN